MLSICLLSLWARTLREGCGGRPEGAVSPRSARRDGAPRTPQETVAKMGRTQFYPFAMPFMGIFGCLKRDFCNSLQNPSPTHLNQPLYHMSTPPRPPCPPWSSNSSQGSYHSNRPRLLVKNQSTQHLREKVSSLWRKGLASLRRPKNLSQPQRRHSK